MEFVRYSDDTVITAEQVSVQLLSPRDILVVCKRYRMNKEEAEWEGMPDEARCGRADVCRRGNS